MKKRVSPGFYNSEMESKYFHLYISSILLNRKRDELQPNDRRLIRFELDYYKVSKKNKILNDISKNKDEIIKYLEPTDLKKKVDKNAEKLGIKPYDKLDQKEESFIML